jgi:F-box protein 9
MDHSQLFVFSSFQIPVGAILEVVYYRYLYFQEDGRVLYALTSTSPHEMFQRLLKVCLNRKKPDKDGKGGAGGSTLDKSIVWGTYQVQKDNVTIVARQPWHTIQFELTIQNTTTASAAISSSKHSMWDDPPDGKFGRLTLDRHLSSPSGCFEEWSQDRVEYKVPEESFRFIRSNRL